MKKYIFILLAAMAFVACSDDEPTPKIVEDSIDGFEATIQKTATAVYVVEFTPKETYKGLITPTGWEVQEIFLLNGETGDFDFKNDYAGKALDWATVEKSLTDGKATLQVTLSENTTKVKRGLLVCVGQRGTDGREYIGVAEIIQE